MTHDEINITQPIIQAALDVASSVSAQAMFAYAGALDGVEPLVGRVQPPTELILVCRNEEELERAKAAGVRSLSVPAFDLTRMGQIKMATLLAFSQQLLKPGDIFVFLAGVTGKGIDSLVTMRVGEEFELFQSVGQPKLTEHIRRPVFERVIRIALELAHEGREGKPVGAIFVVGDQREVLKYASEGRINPFRGYTEKERNILDETIADTVKEIAKLDGAFIIKGNGVIVQACATLRPAGSGERLPQGLGTRHAAAAAITSHTKCLAVTLSESTGDVRVWRRGTLITEIEKSPRHLLDGTTPPNMG